MSTKALRLIFDISPNFSKIRAQIKSVKLIFWPNFDFCRIFFSKPMRECAMPTMAPRPIFDISHYFSKIKAQIVSVKLIFWPNFDLCRIFFSKTSAGSAKIFIDFISMNPCLQ